MIKKIAWEMFEKTGNINTFLAFKNIDNTQMENSNLLNNMSINDIDVTNKEEDRL